MNLYLVDQKPFLHEIILIIIQPQKPYLLDNNYLLKLNELTMSSLIIDIQLQN